METRAVGRVFLPVRPPGKKGSTSGIYSKGNLMQGMGAPVVEVLRGKAQEEQEEVTPIFRVEG